jgi:hypothetical protein
VLEVFERAVKRVYPNGELHSSHNRPLLEKISEEKDVWALWNCKVFNFGYITEKRTLL